MVRRECVDYKENGPPIGLQFGSLSSSAFSCCGRFSESTLPPFRRPCPGKCALHVPNAANGELAENAGFEGRLLIAYEPKCSVSGQRDRTAIHAIPFDNFRLAPLK